MVSAAEQLVSNLNFAAFAKADELKKRIWFTLVACIRYLLGSYSPIPGINPMVENRRAWLLAHAVFTRPIPTLTQLRRTPIAPLATDTVWVTVKATTPAGSTLDVRLFDRSIGA